MKYFISGYGENKQDTIRLYEDQTLLWNSQIANPSYLCQTEDLLFAVGEFDDHCTITSFRKNGSGYEQVDRITLDGTALCHLDADPVRRLLAASCWGNGLFFLVSYKPGGTFDKVVYHEFQSDGTDAVSRVHCARFCGDRLFVVNIELDRIYTYQLKNQIPEETAVFSLPKGTGPRHIQIDTKKQLMYCVTEYSSQLLTFRIKETGELQLLSTLSLLAPDFHDRSDGSSLAVTADGRHLYAANRGENTIAHFLLDEEGMPAFSNRFSCLGNWPRHIALLHQDHCLAIANQFSGEAVFINRDPQTGDLTDEAYRLSLPQCSYVAEDLFLG